MLILDHSRYLHVPKCGGCWVIKTLLKAQPSARAIYGKYAGGAHVQAHLSYPSAPCPELFTFCSIRPPDDWLRALWVNRMKENWQFNWPANRFRSDDFREFVQNILGSPTPGFVDAFFYAYCGDPSVEVLPLGNLRSALIGVLELSGESFDLNVVRNMPADNPTDYNLFKADWDEEQRQAILAANTWAAQRHERAARKWQKE